MVILFKKRKKKASREMGSMVYFQNDGSKSHCDSPAAAARHLPPRKKHTAHWFYVFCAVSKELMVSHLWHVADALLQNMNQSKKYKGQHYIINMPQYRIHSLLYILAVCFLTAVVFVSL